MKEQGISLDAVLDVNVDASILIRRIVGRRICKTCGATYHIDFNKPKKKEFVTIVELLLFKEQMTQLKQQVAA